MKRKILLFTVTLALLSQSAVKAWADSRGNIARLGQDLGKAAAYLAESSFDHFKGWSDEISDQEQVILFESEAFAASCRLFLRLIEDRSDFFQTSHLRTNLHNAFMYLVHAFQDLEGEMRKGGVMPYALNDCRRILAKMEDEFSRWPMADNLAYLHQKYIKAGEDTVYLIERKGQGEYVRSAFKNLESLYRYNYDLKRGKNPWEHLVEVSEDTLKKMKEGPALENTFEGLLVIEMGNRPNRSVYLIQNGKKRGITSPAVLQRYGGWGRVFEVPAEVISSYPDGEPIY